MTRIILRLIAIAIAVAAAVDPSIAVAAAIRPRIAVVVADADAPDAGRVRDDLLGCSEVEIYGGDVARYIRAGVFEVLKQ